MPSRTEKTIGIIGGKGMLGSDLVDFLSEHYTAVAIDKDNYEEHKGKEFDVLINANGNSRRFWANEHPYEDFMASAVSVYRTISDFHFGIYIIISSSDVYPDHSSPSTTDEAQEIDPVKLSPYGFHKILAEYIVRDRCPRYFVLRSSMILGRHLKKGPIFDILGGKELFITLDSCLQMITTRAIADIVKSLLAGGKLNEIYNMGGRGSVAFGGIGRFFNNVSIAVSDRAEMQAYEVNVSKLAARVPLKTSEEYLREHLA